MDKSSLKQNYGMKKPVGREGSRGGVGQKETTSNGTRKAIHGNAM